MVGVMQFPKDANFAVNHMTAGIKYHRR